MKTTLFSMALLLMCSTTTLSQTVVGDVTLPATMKAGSSTLVLNGGGIREKMWLDLYVGGLYLQAKSSDANSIMQADQPMAIRLEIVSGLISSAKMVAAVEEGFEKSTKGKHEAMRTKIDRFKKCFMAEIAVGDVYELIYVPKTGVQVWKNGALSDTIDGLDFKTALFGIWLCNDPADEDLKAGMLGKG